MTRLVRQLLLGLCLSWTLQVSAAPGTYQLMLSGDSVLEARETSAKSGADAKAQVDTGKARRRALIGEHALLQKRLAGSGTVVIGSTYTLANSLLVTTDDASVERLRSLPGVMAVERVRPMERHTRTSVPFIGAPQVWLPRGAESGFTGRGVRIAIVDSGIDYLHAQFGGSGNPSDYAANDPSVIEPGTFPTAKVIDGWDFAGDDYDAGGEFGSTSPMPDEDPLDPRANGHGSHVAGIAAGLGVLADGSPFAGPYGASIYTNRFLIGPGVAPEASIIAFKVFGARGNTALVPLALDAAADPNGDGNTADRVDVLNLSLGSPFATEGEVAQTGAINRLVNLGTVVVISAGNSGNTHYVVGSPGAAAKAITVANTYDDGSTSSTISVTAPAEVAGEYAAVEGVFTLPIASAGKITAQVVATLPANACQDGDNGRVTNTSEVKGKIALIDRGTCFFSSKVRAAQQAGAVAVVMVNNVDGFPIPMGGSGDTSDIKIPGVMISRTDGAILRRRLADGLFITLEPRSATVRPELADRLNDSSSRGPVAYSSRLKPDLAAPGSSIPSTRAGYGTEAVSMTGTSMSAPHVAGAAALIRQARPTWNPLEIKAALMNTATRTANGDGVAYPESRVGAGRLALIDALATPVIARNASASDQVSISMGALELSGPHTEERRVRLTNKGTQPVTLTLSASNTVGAAAARMVPMLAQVTISAGQDVSVPFRFEANPAGTGDEPTTGDVQGSRFRPKMPEASGQLWFHGGPVAIHVPWHVIVRPLAPAHAGALRVGLPAGSGMATIPLPTVRNGVQPPGLVGVFQLGGTSPSRNLTFPNGAGDLLAYGAATDKPGGDIASARVFFGMATSGKWITPQRAFTTLDVEIDLDNNGTVDARVVNTTAGNLNGDDIDDDSLSTDFLLSAARTQTGTNWIEGGTLNVLDPRSRDTALFHNGVLVHSVPASALGLGGRRTAFRYRVSAASEGANETTGWATFDLAAPQVATEGPGLDGSPWFPEGQRLRLRVARSGSVVQALLLHLHNAVGSQAEVIRLNPATGDEDGNGLVDAQELAYFPGLGTAPDSDPDGDGISTIEELRLGSDPTDGASPLKVQGISTTVGADGRLGARLSWSGQEGRRYSVLRAERIEGPFIPIATALGGTLGSQSFQDPQPPANGAFYRVQVE
ncbi:MAG: S8 family serine peptidase [Verrucomicrobiota bacterium]